MTSPRAMEALFQKWLKRNGRSADPCNCGGPAMGTDHAPDCAWNLSVLNLWDLFQDELENP